MVIAVVKKITFRPIIMLKFTGCAYSNPVHERISDTIKPTMKAVTI